MTAPSSGPHVLQVTPRFWPDSGGIETHVHEVTRRLVDRGWHVEVLAGRRDPSLQAHERTTDGYLLHRMSVVPRSRDWMLAPALPWLLARSRADLVHFQGVHTLVPVLGMISCIVLRRPYVLTLHTGGHSSGLRTRARSLQWRLLGPLLRRARVVIGVSQYEVGLIARLARLDPSRLRVIRNGGTPAAPDAAPVAFDPASAHDGPLLVSIGRLERYKGHGRALEALPYLLERFPQARLVVLGTGPDEQLLRARADELGLADRVVVDFVPGGDRDELFRRLRACHLAVMLSDYEAHPVAVMEALAVGLPVLVLAGTGLTELAEAGWCRAVPPAAGPAEVAAAMVEQLLNPVRPVDVSALPTWEGAVEALVEVYTAVHAGRASHPP